MCFGAITVRYAADELSRNLRLAYALTVHKAQGSEYPLVVMVLLNRCTHPNLVRRNLLYTAMTRATRRLVLITSESTVSRAVVTTDPRLHAPSVLLDRLCSVAKRSRDDDNA